MRILIINVPHPSIGSRIPDDHLPPLGLLAIGGPLIDAGHQVRLFDADLEAGRETKIWKRGEYGNTSIEEILEVARSYAPDAILFGHSGSTSAHPVISDKHLRHAMRWYTEMGRRVWPYEVKNFFFRDRRTEHGPTLTEMWGAPQDEEERSMTTVSAGRLRMAANDARAR